MADEADEPGLIEWWQRHDLPAPWAGPTAIPDFITGKVWDQAREWIVGKAETADKGFDEMQIPGAPPQDDPPEDDDSGWLAFALALAWGLWELWEWLGTDPSLTLFEIHTDPLWTFTFDEPDPETVETIVVATSHFEAPVPFAARIGDPMVHGGLALPGPGSPDVLIEGLPALRMIDQVVCPVQAPVPHIPGPWVASQTDVLINGVPALRAGDYLLEMPGGPNPIVVGAPMVIVGAPAPGVDWYVHGVDEVEVEDDDVIHFRWKKIEIGRIDGEVKLGLSQLGPWVGFEGDVTPVHIYAEAGATTEVDLPGDEFDVRAEGTVPAEVILGKTHVDAKAYVGWRDVLRRRLKIRSDVDYDVDPIDVEIGDPELDVEVGPRAE